MPETMTSRPRRAVLVRLLVALFLVAGALFGMHCASDGPQTAGHAATHLAESVIETVAIVTEVAPTSHGEGAPTGLLALCVSVAAAVLFACARLTGALDVQVRALPPRRTSGRPAVVFSCVDLTRLCVLRT
ncbi:hypothetical protein [Alloactinosynnema sp. L-07]|uniref:hypothetical protein n=1 Tax=Alloactinosynnema sp. L-07 TaxID=1653480 RepID=UPI00065F07D5|nr:hypothetical protein [Alloactinosynnema sp. L-07]CRK55132.1 hypothetical protein [Alloactinosynnema sp. L-07]